MDKRRRHVPLRAALWRRGMTQRELAETLGVSESLVSMYMSGKKPMGLDRRLENSADTRIRPAIAGADVIRLCRLVKHLTSPEDYV